MTAEFYTKIIDGWWILLNQLSHEAKLELAMRLINSVKTPKPESTEEGWLRLCGAWKNENESAEDLITKIKDSRIFNRKIELLD